jgi:hypothetical protein
MCDPFCPRPATAPLPRSGRAPHFFAIIEFTLALLLTKSLPPRSLGRRKHLGNHCGRNVANHWFSNGMEYMSKITSLTLADAASGTGIFKSNIFSAIKSCRLSGALSEYGQPRIEAAELHRELAEACARASLAEQRVADLTAMLDDVREQRDRWQAQADRLSSVLTDQQRKAPRWWPWRRSTRDGARLQITHVRDNPSDLKSD